ncbi:MAG: hypothetical protein M3Q69_08170 [Acidobacteriota bacterium]|nr:hypothetical protein [Acidobacteriota bacterium]
MGAVERCVAADERVWFLSSADFEEQSDAAFAWNEFEVASLAATEVDDAWKRQITSFWARHLPIATSVRSGYAFLAIELRGSSTGPVVIGREPEYESVSPVCDSFSELLRLFAAAHFDRLPPEFV